jgi:hypothetical protein
VIQNIRSKLAKTGRTTFSLECCQLQSQGSILDRNGLMTAQQQWDESN